MDLKWKAEETGALPARLAQEFGFDLRSNDVPRGRKGEKDYFYPLDVMRGFWLGLLDHASPRPDNVVPFRRA